MQLTWFSADTSNIHSSMASSTSRMAEHKLSNTCLL